MESTKGVRLVFLSNFRISVAHEVLPDFDSASSFQDVNANGTLCETNGILAKEVVHDFGVVLHVELHLSLFHDFEACFGNTWLDVEAVLKSVILDYGDSARSRPWGRTEDSMVVLGCETSGRRRNGHLEKFRQGK
jgi:hypothetical protein